MKFISYWVGSEPRYGVIHGEGVIDITLRHGKSLPDLRSFIAQPDWREKTSALLAGTAPDYQYKQLQLRSVIPNPEKILCVALNYSDHVAEANSALPGGRETPKYPVLFARFPSSLVGHQQPIIRPRLSTQLDYEAELVLVIGKKTPRYVQPQDALNYVFGYTAMNEGSVRDYQFHSRQLTPGKNFEASGSTGPWLVTTDEVADPQKLDITFTLNGEVLQHANTANMIFDIGRLLAYITQWITLEPGDLVATGTMGGVGFTRKPPIFMKPGDRAEVRIENVGVLSNPVAEET